MPDLSAVLIAQDESARIERAVESVAPWVSEVLVLDGGSLDDTVERARRSGARVVVRPFDGFVTQKQAATDAAKHDLIFSLDADEIVDDELGRALEALAGGQLSPETAAWWVRRRNYLDGRVLRASGWYPDRRLRLFDRRRARWVGRDPHDRVESIGPLERLPGHIHHDPERTTRSYRRATERHADRGARSLVAHGRRPGVLQPWLHGLGHLLRKWLIGRAWLDGRRGWTVAWIGARGVFRKYRSARDLSR